MKDGVAEWLIRSESGNYRHERMSVIPYEDDKNYVYIGSGAWSLYEKSEKGEFLVGGPELSDDTYLSGIARGAAADLSRRETA